MKRFIWIGLLLLIAQACAQAEIAAPDVSEQLAGVQLDVHQAPG